MELMIESKKQLDRKTLNFLTYIIANMANPTKTALIKMSYLCDLAAMNSGIKKITSFDYIRYYYGPYDKRIEDYLFELAKKRIIKARTLYTMRGEEYEEFSIAEQDDEKLANIAKDFSEQERSVIDSILETLGEFSAKALTQVAYRTAPMKALGATLGGDEHLGEKINLSIKKC